MPRICTVCSHDARAEIDAALAEGRGSIRGIAQERGLSADAVSRHAKAHLPTAIVKAQDAAEATRADGLLEILHEGVRDARRLRDRAEKEGDVRAALVAVRTLVDIVEKLADVGERLAKSGEAGPIRVEYVNDWRAPVGLIPGEPDA